MASRIVELANRNHGDLRRAPVGFSWTMFFFGFWVPVFRRDWKWALICLPAVLATGGLFAMMFAFYYNRIYLNEMMKRGWRPLERHQPSTTPRTYTNTNG